MTQNKSDRTYSPLDYALQSCETMMRRFDATQLPPRGRLQGCGIMRGTARKNRTGQTR